MHEFRFIPVRLNNGIYPFPSIKQLSELLNSFPDEDSIKNFREWNDAQIEQMCLVLLDSRSKPIFEPLRNLCILVGYEFTQLFLDLLTHSYYINLFGAGLWGNQKEDRQVKETVIALLKSGKDYEVEASFPYGLAKHQKKIHQSLKTRFVYYELANDRIVNFMKLASFHKGEQVYRLLTEFIEGAFELEKTLPSRIGQSFPLQCVYCQKLFDRVVKPGATKPPLFCCNSSSCKKEHRRLSKRAERGLNEGWQSNRKPMNCPSCGEKRVLHRIEGVCRECWTLKPSPRAVNGERQNRLGDSRVNP